MSNGPFAVRLTPSERGTLKALREDRSPELLRIRARTEVKLAANCLGRACSIIDFNKGAVATAEERQKLAEVIQTLKDLLR